MSACQSSITGSFRCCCRPPTLSAPCRIVSSSAMRMIWIPCRCRSKPGASTCMRPGILVSTAIRGMSGCAASSSCVWTIEPTLGLRPAGCQERIVPVFTGVARSPSRRGPFMRRGAGRSCAAASARHATSGSSGAPDHDGGFGIDAAFVQERHACLHYVGAIPERDPSWLTVVTSAADVHRQGGPGCVTSEWLQLR